MNIQIFGKAKCFGTRSAIRFFRERKIKYQYIDLSEKEISKKEFFSVLDYIKDIDLLFDKKSKAYINLNVEYILRNYEEKCELLLENQELIKTPIVRDSENRKATVGDNTAEWKNWIK